MGNTRGHDRVELGLELQREDQAKILAIVRKNPYFRAFSRIRDKTMGTLTPSGLR